MKRNKLLHIGGCKSERSLLYDKGKGGRPRYHLYMKSSTTENMPCINKVAAIIPLLSSVRRFMLHVFIEIPNSGLSRYQRLVTVDIGSSRGELHDGLKLTDVCLIVL